MKATGYEGPMRRRGGKASRAAAAVRLGPAVLVLLLLGGCHHKQLPPALPAIVQAPVTPPPPPASPSMEGPPPESISTAPTVKVTEAKPKRRAKKAVTKPAETTPAPVETAAAAPAPPPLGELSAGGESSPQSQREANDLILSSEHRLKALSKTAAAQQQAQTREVRHFLEQARQALSTGDIEGAKTLATKAKLLMDDLEKWAQ